MNADAEQRRFLRFLMLALLAWGAMLALGTFLYRVQREGGKPADGSLPLYRGLIVLGCTLAFLGLWLAALAVRARRQPTGEPPQPGAE